MKTRKAFTIIEVLVASVIGAIVAVVAVGMLQAVSITSEKARTYTESASELAYASDMIRSDLRNLHRHPEGRHIAWMPSQLDGIDNSLRFKTVSKVKARQQMPEGDVYEVEYSLRINGENEGVLTRRYWPNPSVRLDAGGILSVIARDVIDFRVQFFDEKIWHDQWDSSGEMPVLVSVTLNAKPSKQKQVMQESFIVHFPKMPTNSARSGE